MMVVWVVGSFVGWSLLVGIVAAQFPHTWFARTLPMPSARFSRFARRLGVDRWRRALPDAGGWFGDARKDAYVRRDQLERFVAESRRAEMVHWCALAALPVLLVWAALAVAPWAIAALLVVAVVANIPCVIALRYNRDRAIGVLRRTRRASTR